MNTQTALKLILNERKINFSEILSFESKFRPDEDIKRKEGRGVFN